MGVPQRRRRVFFIALRNDLAENHMEQIDMFQMAPKLDLNFNEPLIRFGEYRDKHGNSDKLTDRQKRLLELRIPGEKSFGDVSMRVDNKLSGFTDMIVEDNDVSGTITANGKNFRACDNTWFTDRDYALTGSYPTDYNYMTNKAQYLIGMSVPPVMVAQIATNIFEQWLNKIK